MCDVERHDSSARLTTRREAIRAGLGAALAAVLPMPFGTWPEWHATGPDGRYLEAALAAARWIRATAIDAPAGKTWPAVPPDEKTVQRDLYTGTPGVLLFLVELYRATNDRSWLDLAVAGADHLATTQPAAGDGDSFGLYSGAAGVAYALDEVSRASGLDRVQRASERTLGDIHRGARDVGGGVEWNDTTDIISGSAGIGLYLLRVAATRNDARAKALAVRAGRRLLEREYRHGSTGFWMMTPGFTRNMPNFSHGTAGVAYFLASLAGETGDPDFRDAAIRGARYLQSIASRTSGDGRRIFHNDPDGRELFYLSWCHGPAGTARLFHRLGSITRDTTWLDYVPRLAQGTIASGVPERSPGFWNNISQCCGNCGVSDFFVSLHATTGKPEYLAFARRVADDTLARGTPDGDGMKWIQAENRVSPNEVYAQTGLMQGAAGVGLSMLRLDGALRGRRPTIVLPDSPAA